jgi:hypothetical protein
MCLDVKATCKIASGCNSYTVTDCSGQRFVPKTPEPDLHTYELKYKNQILRSLRRRANGFGFDLVELPKAA